MWLRLSMRSMEAIGVSFYLRALRGGDHRPTWRSLRVWYVEVMVVLLKAADQPKLVLRHACTSVSSQSKF